MSFDITTFRTNFPEFTSATVYPDQVITFWSGLADKMLTVERWGDFLTEGLQLLTAHLLVLATLNSTTPAGTVPGRSTGLLSSQGVGGVSVSFDNAASLIEGGGHYNETIYGRQFLSLARIVGTGGAYV